MKSVRYYREAEISHRDGTGLSARDLHLVDIVNLVIGPRRTNSTRL